MYSLIVLAFLRAIECVLNAYLVVLGLFLPKTEGKEEEKIHIVNSKKKIYVQIRVGRREGGQPMWIILKLYNIIIKSNNMDKGGVGKMIINKICFFLPVL